MPVLSGQLFPLGRRGVTVSPLAPPPPLPGLNLRKCKAPYPATMETRMGGKGRRDRGGMEREGKGRGGKEREGERSGGVGWGEKRRGGSEGREGREGREREGGKRGKGREGGGGRRRERYRKHKVVTTL